MDLLYTYHYSKLQLSLQTNRDSSPEDLYTMILMQTVEQKKHKKRQRQRSIAARFGLTLTRKMTLVQF